MFFLGFHLPWGRGIRSKGTPALGQFKEHTEFLVSRSLTLPADQPWAAGVIWWLSWCSKKVPSSILSSHNPSKGCLEDIAISDQTVAVTTHWLSNSVKLLFKFLKFWCTIKCILFFSISCPKRKWNDFTKTLLSVRLSPGFISHLRDS